MESILKPNCDRCGKKIDMNDSVTRVQYGGRTLCLCNECKAGLDAYIGADSATDLGDPDQMDEEVEL